MRHRWFAAGAVIGVLAVVGGDFFLLDLPFVRNGGVTYLALLVPIALGFIALRIVKSFVTIAALALVLLLSLGYAASRTVLVKMPPGGPVIKQGDIAPPFALKAPTGQEMTLPSIRGDRQLVLVFYRGHW